MSESEVKPTGIAMMRAPFKANQISKLPKESKAQIDERKSNRDAGMSCQICGSWHHKRAVHLDYVGHAALTDRLLDCDPLWSWEPMSYDENMLPRFDATGGLWIKLTVCGVTRLGYGHAAHKAQGDPGMREKEVIGDALRNAAMRFGAALELWHKGDLHAVDESIDTQETKQSAVLPANATTTASIQKRELYADDAFAANFPKWQSLIEAGKKTPDDIINSLNSKAILTEDQIAAIREIANTNAQEQPE